MGSAADTHRQHDNVCSHILPASDVVINKVNVLNPAVAKQTKISYPAVPDYSAPVEPESFTADEFDHEGVSPSQIVLYLFLWATVLTFIW